MGEEGGTRLVFASLVILGGVAGSLWTSILLGHGSLGLFVTDLTFRYINMNPSFPRVVRRVLCCLGQRPVVTDLCELCFLLKSKPP